MHYHITIDIPGDTVVCSARQNRFAISATVYPYRLLTSDDARRPVTEQDYRYASKAASNCAQVRSSSGVSCDRGLAPAGT